MVMPRVRAVLRLTRSSNLVGRSMGGSPGLAPLENQVDVLCRASKLNGYVRSICDQATGVHEVAQRVEARKLVLGGEGCDVLPIVGSEWLRQHEESLRFSTRRLERVLQCAHIPHTKELQFSRSARDQPLRAPS